MLTFSIILTSPQSLNLSFPLLFYAIFTAIIKFRPWFPILLPWFPTFFAFSPRFFAFPNWFPVPAFPSYSSHSHPYSSLIPFRNSSFWLLQIVCSVVIFKNIFYENSCFSSKTNTPLCYYCITLGTKLLFTSSTTSSVLSPKII